MSLTRQNADEPLILLDLPLSRDYFLSTFRSIGVTPNITDRTNDLSVACNLVANGFGYSLLSIGTEVAYAPDGQPLAILPTLEAVGSVTLGLTTKQVTNQSAIVRALKDHACVEVKEHGLPATKAVR